MVEEVVMMDVEEGGKKEKKEEEKGMEVDEEREGEEAKDVLEFWFGPNVSECAHQKWFTSQKQQEKIDIIIMKKFKNLLNKAESGLLDEWKNDPKHCVALIIVLDQFSRHIYRHEEGRPSVLRNDKKALSLCYFFLDHPEWSVLRELTSEEHVFLLMPLRHTPTPDRLRLVMQHIKMREDYSRSSNIILERFRKITNHRLLDQESGSRWTSQFEDLFEFEEQDLDKTNMSKETLYKTVESFIREKTKGQKMKSMIISLSGGVDSMVLALIIHDLAPKFGNYDTYAIHVDYSNRPESGAEAEFVQDWSKRHGLTKCFVRKIDEVRRATTPRDQYEKIARELRFGYYKEVRESLGEGCGSVMFGHHQGDLQENVISNMMKGGSLLELSGMSSASVVNGVEVWRPMLPHTKAIIFDFAHKYGIPYFKDTTPKWSTRGKMRNQLMPLLTDMYGDGFLRHVSNLGNDAGQISELLTFSVFRSFFQTVGVSGVGVWMDFGQHLALPTLFYVEVLRRICHKVLGIGMIRQKSIESILQPKLRSLSGEGRKLKENTFIALRKDIKTFLNGTKLIFFRPNFFPKTLYWINEEDKREQQKKEEEKKEEKKKGDKKKKGEKGGGEIEVEVGVGEHRFGPWVVVLGWVEEEEMEEGVAVVRERKWVGGGEGGKKRKRGKEEEGEGKGKGEGKKEVEGEGKGKGEGKKEEEEKKERGGVGVMEVISGRIQYYLPSSDRFVVFPKGFKGSGVVLHPTIREVVPFVVGRGVGEGEGKRFLEVIITAEMRNEELLAVPEDILLTATHS